MISAIRRWWRRFTGAEFAETWIREYREIWPNGCPVCAFDRNWRQFGGTPTTPPHFCPEGNHNGVDANGVPK